MQRRQTKRWNKAGALLVFLAILSPAAGAAEAVDLTTRLA